MFVLSRCCCCSCSCRSCSRSHSPRRARLSLGTKRRARGGLRAPDDANDANDANSQKTRKKRTVLSCLSSTKKKKKKRRTLRKGERCSRVASCERETRPFFGVRFPQSESLLNPLLLEHRTERSARRRFGRTRAKRRGCSGDSLSLSLSSGILFARDFVRVKLDDAAAL